MIVILADDLGFGDVAHLNPESRIPTPNLDALAEHGMAFVNAHSPSAVCTPTRYALLTGRYAWRTRLKSGVLDGFGKPLIASDRPTIGTFLSEHGYRTAVVGKWHLGLEFARTASTAFDFGKPVSDGPHTHGFDESFIIPASLDFPPYLYIRNGDIKGLPLEWQQALRFPRFMRAGNRASNFNPSDVLDELVRQATDFIDRQSRESQPFLLYFPLTAPHKPVWPAERFRGRTDLGPYGDFVVQVDATVGDILNAVDAAGIRDSTVVFFTSDNGSFMYRRNGASQPDHTDDETIQAYRSHNHTSNYVYRGTKADIWEAGHRVPFLVRWPGQIPPGSVRNETVSLTDVFATLAEIIGEDLPEDAAGDSFSLLPLLRGGNWDRPRVPVVHHSLRGMFAIRDGKWKLVAGNGSGGRERPTGIPFRRPYQLYDLHADPEETNNLLDGHPQVVARLEASLEAIRSHAEQGQPASDVTSLSGLALGGVDFGSFDPGKTTYVASVDSGLATTTVTATPKDAFSTIVVADFAGEQSGASRTVSLAEGANPVTVTVTAPDGRATRTYTVWVNRSSPGAAAPPLTPADFTVTVSPSTIAEGDTAMLTVALEGGVTFAEDQAIALAVTGSASAADYRLSPEALTLPAGASSVTAELAALDDDEDEEPETVTVTPSLGTITGGSATVTIRSVSHDATLSALSLSGIDIGAFSGTVTSYTASVGHAVETTTVTVTRAEEPALPEVSIAAVEERVAGPIGEFTVSRTGPTAEPLEVQVLFATSRTQRVQTLRVRLLPGQSSVRRRVQGGDNRLVEDDITVTWTLEEGEGYTVSAEHASASLVLEESDIPEFSVSVEPAGIAEGESATVTVAISNGVRFREAQTIALAVSGTASGSDYTGVPETLTLRAYGTSATLATLTAAVDHEQEAEETVTITASHGGSEIGSATVTIGAGEAPPLTARFEGMPATHDGETPFQFQLRFSEGIKISYKTLRDVSFRVTAGDIKRARRVDGRRDLWEITVEPASESDVELALPVTADCEAAGAVCTAGGKPLSQRLEATVRGPGPEAVGEGFSLAPGNSSPSGIWSDGETAWVADLADARLYAYSREDGEQIPEKDISTGPAPMGLWSDGETLWVAGLGGGLRAHRLADGSRLAGRDLALEASAAPAGVWSDGETAWVSDWLGDTLHAYRLAGGERAAGRDIELAGGNLLPVGLWSNGETLWVADWRERLYAYRLSDGERMPDRDIEAGAGDSDPSGLWSTGVTLLSTSWEGGEVRAYAMPPAAPRSMDAGRAKVGGEGSFSVSAISDPALLTAIRAALGKPSGSGVSAGEIAGLEVLKARNAGISDLTGLEGMASLKELDLGFNPLADLRPLTSLARLEFLNLDGAVPDLLPLASLARLKRLSARNNGIDDLQPLAPLAGLAELDIGDNRIEDLSPLAGMTGLTALRADRNRIADLWPLASLARLEALELGENRVRDLRPLAGMARLRTLRLRGNSLAELYPLAGLEGLSELVLADNAAEDLRPLAGMAGLRRLDLRGNPVADMRPLRAMPSLVWVHVGGSRIEDLAPLDGLPGLTVAGRDDREPPSSSGESAGRAGRH